MTSTTALRIAIALVLALPAQAAELPIRQVVLYKHGIGYFLRLGTLGPNDSVQLDFSASEMNDVLKSLTLQESGTGRVSGLRYDSSDPLEKKLAEFPFQIGPGQPLTAILDQLKGTRLEMKTGAETLGGVLVSARLVPRTEQRAEMEQVTLLLDNGEFRNVDLNAVSSLQFQDPALQAQFQEYLRTLNAARSREKRSLYIDSTGSQARDVTATYMIPMPVWKSSYRLIFPTTGEPTLEGWAIVDNTTGDDWTNIRLSLVSGRPISFISRLYEPRYVDRPVAELPEDQARAPVVYGGAIEEERDEQMAKMADAAGRQRQMNEPASAPMVAREMMASGGFQFGQSSVAATAGGADLGELFEYSFSAPVTVRSNESAMLPFLQEKLSARKLLIYSDQSTVNPLNSVEITNSTSKTLDGGPITVYDAGAYAGEALVETLKKGDKRLLSYGVDLGTRITTAFESDSGVVREAHFQRGVLATKTAVVETRTYTIRNVDLEPKTLVIEHPVRQGYKVLNQTPVETTANAYRFEVLLGPDAIDRFAVKEERVIENSIAVINLTPDVIASFVQNRNISQAARTQLGELLNLKRDVASADSELARLQQRIDSLFQDQERIRQNINSLNRVPGQEQQVQAYSRQLAAQEAELATLRDQHFQTQQRRGDLEEQINDLVARMDF
jgi:hypothetical protein